MNKMVFRLECVFSVAERKIFFTSCDPFANVKFLVSLCSYQGYHQMLCSTLQILNPWILQIFKCWSHLLTQHFPLRMVFLEFNFSMFGSITQFFILTMHTLDQSGLSFFSILFISLAGLWFLTCLLSRSSFLTTLGLLMHNKKTNYDLCNHT